MKTYKRRNWKTFSVITRGTWLYRLTKPTICMSVTRWDWEREREQVKYVCKVVTRVNRFLCMRTYNEQCFNIVLRERIEELICIAQILKHLRFQGALGVVAITILSHFHTHTSGTLIQKQINAAKMIKN